MTIQQKIFPIELVLESMTASGYKDAAHAVAELIDNSIQAGEHLESVDIELLCIEQNNFGTDRTASKIQQIAVFDNGIGMDAETLKSALAFGHGTRKDAKKGIGKFGMGLPNASISQCDYVEVYSWQDKRVFRSYLNLNELLETGRDTLVDPVEVDGLPGEWKERIKAELRESGTLVIWNNLNRLKWKRHKTFFNNTEFIVGRMYRYFITSGKCSIRMSAYNGSVQQSESYVKPNDPLYLMKDTSAPAPLNDGKQFVEIPPGGEILKVNFGGQEHEIVIKFSHVLPDFRKNYKDYYNTEGSAGSTLAGQHCAKNIGISVIRAGRELELNTSFNIAYNTLERWWGGEIHFDPALDKVFGVTNNKQAATAFKEILVSDVADEEGIGIGDVENFLEEDDPSKYILLKISEVISSKLRVIRKSIKEQQEGSKKLSGSDGELQPVIPEEDDELGGGRSEQAQEGKSDEALEEELKEEIEKDNPGLTEEEKRLLLKKALESDSKFIIVTGPIRGSDLLYDVTNPAGKIKLTINSEHPFYKEYISKLEGSDSGKEILDAIKLVFSAWALMEDRVQDDKLHDALLEIRKDWGTKAKKMISSYIHEMNES